VLVLSEFAGAAEELTEAVIINPYDIDACADAIGRALDMPRLERAARMRALRQRVRARTVHGWAEAFLEELDRPAAVPPAADAGGKAPFTDPQELIGFLRGRSPLVLLLDYDGTLVPIASLPDLARPDAELSTVLQELADAGVQIHIVSGRRREDLTAWFGDLPATLWSEHGAWHREHGGSWCPTMNIGREWIPPIRDILEQFAACTPGALIEEKGASIAWHYRTADPEFGPKQALELKLILVDALHNQPLDILEGSKVIEIRPRGVNKARVVERILLGNISPASLVAIGDDRTDEEMFAAMPPGSTSIHVGKGPTEAGYRIPDSAAVRVLLRGLAAAARTPSAPQR
jgi:trehalose 6-phosphate synthase/phosphatase